ncbi:MAG TPA: XkdF-like putative serine protease domain-containing protein [Ignavibacteria bacterium]|nr:XkdF-like putative serine protease domain-containing protein [Ignavibacteria bacterium]
MAKYKLKDVDVELLSFVDKAANKRNFIYKAAGVNEDDAFSFNKHIEIAKIDEEKRLVYGVVYAPGEADAHDDMMDIEEVEKACHRFMTKSNTRKAVDTQHDLNPVDDVTIVECAILRGTHDILKDEKPGTWYVVSKVDNDEVWKSVKDGTYTGYSLYGHAVREEVAKSTKQKLVDRLMKWLDSEEDEAISNEVVKGFNEKITRFKVNTVVDAISSSLYDILWDEFKSIDEKLKAVIQVLDDAKAYAQNIDLAKGEVIKAGKVISDSNMKKLQAAMDAMQSLMDSAGTAESKRAEINKQIKNKTTMENITKEDHEKAVADAVKKSEDEKAELQKKLDEANAALEKSKGSQQVEDQKPADEVKKGLPFLR